MTVSFATRFLHRFAQPFLAKSYLTTNWSLSPKGLLKLLFVKADLSYFFSRRSALMRSSEFLARVKADFYEVSLLLSLSSGDFGVAFVIRRSLRHQQEH